MTLKEYNQAVDLYADNLYRFVLKNCKNEAEAKDIVQDTFLKCWQKKETVEATKIKAYLFTTAYHTLIDVTRKTKLQTDYASTNISFEHEQNAYSDLQEVLNIALEKLPTDQKTVLLLRDYEGYSYQEIAELTHLTESQVKVYIFRARTFLKTYIGSIETVI